MQISSRFTIAVHVLACVAVLDGRMMLNSETIAESVGVNPVAVRNIFRQRKPPASSPCSAVAMAAWR